MAEKLGDKPLVNFGDLFPGEYLAAKDLMGKGPVGFTIAKVVDRKIEVEPEKFQDGKKIPAVTENKTVIIFKGCDQTMILGPLNGSVIRDMFDSGDSVKPWIGKRIWLYATDQIMPFGGARGRDRFCVRVYGSPDIAADMTVFYKAPRRTSAVKIELKCSRPTDTTSPPNSPVPTTTEPGVGVHKPGE